MILHHEILDRDVAMDGKNHRLWLMRECNPAHKNAMLIFLMVNPSRARGVGIGDPTQRKGHGFADRLGYRRYGFINLFSASTPYPRDLFYWGYEHAVGRHNDDMLRLVFEWAEFYQWPIVCAWGKPNLNKADSALVERRIAEVLKIREAMEIVSPLYCLATTPDNWPRHPLMLGYEHASLKPWVHL